MGYGSFEPIKTLSPHITDADTVAHYLFNGGLTDAGPSGYTISGSYVGASFDPIAKTRCLKAGAANYTAAIPANLRLLAAASGAALVFLRAAPAGNVPVLGMFAAGGGATADDNYLYSLEITSTRKLYYFHQYGTKTNTAHTSALTVPLNEWCWVAFTRDNAGTALTLALNAATETATLASAPTNGLGADFHVGTQWDSSRLDAVIGSVIVKDVEVTDLDEWRAQTGIGS